MKRSDMIALAAVIVAVLLPLGLEVWRNRRERAREERNEARDRSIADLRDANNRALERIADATKALADLAGGSSALERAHKEGAQLSAQLLTVDRGSWRLIVTNLGPGGAHLQSVAVPDQPNVLLEPDAGLPTDLLPGERHPILAPITMGTRFPIEVELHWIDGRGPQERFQSVMPT